MLSAMRRSTATANSASRRRAPCRRDATTSCRRDTTTPCPLGPMTSCMQRYRSKQTSATRATGGTEIKKGPGADRFRAPNKQSTGRDGTRRGGHRGSGWLERGCEVLHTLRPMLRGLAAVVAVQADVVPDDLAHGYGAAFAILFVHSAHRSTAACAQRIALRQGRAHLRSGTCRLHPACSVATAAATANGDRSRVG